MLDNTGWFSHYFGWIEESFPYIWVVLVAMMGGAVSFYSKVKSGAVERFSIMEFFGEIFTSAFVGILTAFICISNDVPVPVMGALSGITGHMGSRAIFVIEKWLIRKFG